MIERRRVITVLAAVLVVGLFALGIGRSMPRQPRYQGRTLRWWLQAVPQVVSPSDTYEQYLAKRKASTQAIQAMGTNAIPCLISWLQSPDRSIFTSLLVRQHFLPVKIRPDADSNADKHFLANRGFVLLGNDARHALPALVELAQSKEASTRRRAYSVMARLNPDRETLCSAIAPLMASTNWLLNNEAGIFLYAQFPEEAEKLGIHRFDNGMPHSLPGFPGRSVGYSYSFRSGWNTNGLTNALRAGENGIRMEH